MMKKVRTVKIARSSCVGNLNYLGGMDNNRPVARNHEEVAKDAEGRRDPDNGLRVRKDMNQWPFYNESEEYIPW